MPAAMDDVTMEIADLGFQSVPTEDTTAATSQPTAPPRPPSRWAPVALRLWTHGGAQIAAFVISMAAVLAFLSVLHYDAGVVLNALWTGSVGSLAGLGASLENAIPNVLAATAVWVAFRGGLINIGADGQLQIGGLVALVCLITIPNAPPPVLIGVGLLSGTFGGLLWSGIAAALRVWRGANEIIATIMLNFIAFIIITQLTSGILLDKSAAFTTATKPIPAAAHLAPVLSSEANITWAILLAVPLCVAVIAVIRRSNIGLRLAAIGLNRDAALHAGIPVGTYWFSSFCVSGALCGLAGALVIMGSRHYIAPGWAEPWGLYGILIAFLAANSPYLIPIWAFVFGMLTAAGPILEASVGVPAAITVMMQTLPVVVLYALYAGSRSVLRRRRRVALEPRMAQR